MTADDSFFEIVSATYKRLTRAHIEKNAKAAADEFTDNVMLFIHGEAPVTSRVALVVWLSNWYAASEIVSLEFRTIEAWMTGTCGYDVSSYVIEFGGEKQGLREIGTHIVIWKQNAGRWRIAYDIAASVEQRHGE